MEPNYFTALDFTSSVKTYLSFESIPGVTPSSPSVPNGAIISDVKQFQNFTASVPIAGGMQLKETSLVLTRASASFTVSGSDAGTADNGKIELNNVASAGSFRLIPNGTGDDSRIDMAGGVDPVPATTIPSIDVVIARPRS